MGKGPAVCGSHHPTATSLHHPLLSLVLSLSVSLERLGCPEGRPSQSPFLGVPSRTRGLLEVLAKPGSGTSVPSLDAQNSLKTALGREGVDGRPLLTGKWPRSVTSLSLQPPGPAMASKGNQSRRLGQAPSRESRSGTLTGVRGGSVQKSNEERGRERAGKKNGESGLAAWEKEEGKVEGTERGVEGS